MCWKDESETTRGPLLFFSYYPCLQAPNLRGLEPADVAFLESQKCFHVPVGPFLETLIAHYYLYVHPCLPIVNEAEFWPMFRQRQPGSSSFSLLTFQAMLFAACSVSSHIRDLEGISKDLLDRSASQKLTCF